MGLWDVFEGTPFTLPANLIPLAVDMPTVSLAHLPAFASASLPEMGGFDLAKGKSKGLNWSEVHKKKKKEEQADLLKKALDSVLVDDADIGSMIAENEAAQIDEALADSNSGPDIDEED